MSIWLRRTFFCSALQHLTGHFSAARSLAWLLVAKTNSAPRPLGTVSSDHKQTTRNPDRFSMCEDKMSLCLCMLAPSTRDIV